MSQHFSDDTQELLDRAQRAIDQSVSLRAETREHLVAAQRRSFQLELDMYRWRASELGESARALRPGGGEAMMERSSFDDRVGAAHDRGRERDAERARGLQVNEHLDLGNPLHRQIGRLLALEDTAGIHPGVTV